MSDREPNPRINREAAYRRIMQTLTALGGDYDGARRITENILADLIAATPQQESSPEEAYNVNLCGEYIRAGQQMLGTPQEQPRKREFAPDQIQSLISDHVAIAHKHSGTMATTWNVCDGCNVFITLLDEPERDAQEQPRRFTEWEKAAISYALTSMGPGFLMDPKLSTTHGEMRRVLQAMLAESAPEASESSEANEIAPWLPACRKHAAQRCAECASESSEATP